VENKQSGQYLLEGSRGEYGEIGRLTFSPAGSEMLHRTDGSTARIFCCEIDSEAFEASSRLIVGEFRNEELDKCLDVRLEGVIRRMTQMASETLNPAYASEVMIESLTISNLVDLARLLRVEPSHRPQGQLSLWQLRRIDEMLRDFSGKAPTIAELAAQCGMSRSHLCRMFKTTTGRSVHEHVNAARMEMAKSLIMESELPFKAVAFRAGFASQSAFTFAFGKAIGLTPGEFRRQFGRGVSPAPSGLFQ
jgi:AraC family transcriptional regulator